MLLRFVFLLFLLVIGAFTYLAYHNSSQVTFYLTGDKQYQLPIIHLVFISFFLGVLTVWLGYVAYDLRRALEMWRINRREKKREAFKELYRQGVEAIKRGDRESARESLSTYIERDPTNIDAYIHLAGIYSKDENYVDAVKVLSKARLIEPKHAALLTSLASDLRKSGRLDEAILTLENVLDINPSNLDALRELRDIYCDIKRWDDACETQKEVIRHTTKDRKKNAMETSVLLGLRFQQGNHLLEEKEFVKAEGIFKDMMKQDKSFIPSHVGLGDAFYGQGKIEEAAEEWENAFKETGDIIFLHRLEDMCLNEEQPDKILEGYRNVLAERPDDLLVRLFFGKLCLRLEMMEQAIEELHKVESSGVDFPELHFLLAEAYSRRQRYRESVGEFHKALPLKKKMVIPFVCSSCGKELIKWSGCCPACKSCDTFHFPFQQALKDARKGREDLYRMEG